MSNPSTKIVFPRLLIACPLAEDAFKAARREDPDLDYANVAVFARQLIASYKKEDTDYFDKFFAAVEELLDLDDDVRGFVTVGLLESILTNASHESFGADVFVPWMGPKSREAWRWLEAIWHGKSSLADVVRADKGL